MNELYYQLHYKSSPTRVIIELDLGEFGILPGMKSFDELKSMSDAERSEYLAEEVERVIESASPQNRLKLQALQAKCDGIRIKYKDKYLAASKINELMVQSMLDLDYVLAKSLGK